MGRLAEMDTFVHVVERGSFTAAALEMGLSKPQVSRRVKQLEDRLGTRLLNRTTRRVSTTPAGASFHQQATRILAEVDEAEASLAGAQESLRGLLRVTLPMTFGLRYVAPLLAEFLARHATLEIDASYSDRVVDIVEEGFDLAIRVGRLPESSLVAKKIAPTSGCIVASPTYLARKGTPKRPQDLRAHECLIYAYQAGSAWRLHRARAEEVVHVRGRVTANNGEALIAAAVAGLGITGGPDFMVAGHLRDGRLVRVLPDWSMGEGAVWAVYPTRRHLSGKVRSLVEFLAERLGPVPPWERI
jgi:DNA-binding transcriptional LysR family regulator